MTNSEIVAAIATLRRQTVASIRKRVETIIQLALADIYSLVPGFWTKENETFTLGTSGTDAYLVNLKTEFTDFWSLRMLWTADGPINPMSEKQFRVRVPDPTLDQTGRPTVYFFREKNTIELWPHNTSSRTIYIAYRYRPALDNIEIVPEEWRFVVFYYIMSLFEDAKERFFKVKYADGLQRMMNFAKESEEEFSQIIGDGQEEIIYDAMEDVR